MKLIPLTQGKFSEISDHRYDFINQWKWFYNNGYAVRTDNQLKKLIYMHRVIHPSSEGFETDHWDGNELNNQDGNLRTGTHQQNMMNKKPQKNSSSKYKGVSWNKHAKKWKSYIRVSDKYIHLGYFDIEIEAAKAYDQAALEYFGEFSKLNFPQEVMA